MIIHLLLKINSVIPPPLPFPSATKLDLRYDYLAIAHGHGGTISLERERPSSQTLNTIKRSRKILGNARSK